MVKLVPQVDNIGPKGWRRQRRRRNLFRIVHARGAIPNEMGPTHCRGKPALINQEEEEELTTSGNWRGKHNSLSCGARRRTRRSLIPAVTGEASTTRAGGGRRRRSFKEHAQEEEERNLINLKR